MAVALAGMGMLGALHAATVTITGATLDKSVVCRANVDGGITLTANVAPSYDADSDVIVEGTWSNVNPPITSPCGAPGMNRTRTVTRTVTTYSSQALAVNGATANAGANSVNQAVSGADGQYSLAISAVASQVKTVTVYSRTDYKRFTMGNDFDYCQGTFTVTSGPTATTETVSSSSSASYIVDLAGPVVDDPSLGGGNTVFTEKQSVSGSFRVTGGSAGADYSVVFHILSPDNVELGTGTDLGTLPAAPNQGPVGVARDLRVGPLAIQIPCGTVPGAGYRLVATVTSVDLCGNAWDPVDVELGTFTVEPALNLSSQTAVVSQDVNGDYSPYTYFTANVNRRRGTVSSNPGSFHLNQVITVPGQCNDVNSVGGLSATLTVPPGFSFTKTGQGYVHVFVGDLGSNLLDYHDPSPVLVELPFPEALTPNLDGSSTLQVDLSSLGSIPASWTIYMRAKFNFTKATLPLPADGTVFTFGVSDALTLVNDASYPLSNSSTTTLTYGLPPAP